MREETKAQIEQLQEKLRAEFRAICAEVEAIQAKIDAEREAMAPLIKKQQELEEKIKPHRDRIKELSSEMGPVQLSLGVIVKALGNQTGPRSL